MDRADLRSVIVIWAALCTVWVLVTVIDLEPPSTTYMSDFNPRPGHNMGWQEVDIHERARSVTIELDFTTDEEFDVYLVRTEVMEDRPFDDAPPPHLRHMVAGRGPVVWEVGRDEFGPQGLTLVDENMDYGDVARTTRDLAYTRVMVVRNHLDPRTSIPLYLLPVFIGTLVALLLWYRRLPKEVVEVFDRSGQMPPPAVPEGP